VIPAAILLLKSIRHYYDDVAQQLRDDKPLALEHIKPPIILIVAASWNKLTDKALVFALSISPDVYAIQLKAMRGPDHRLCGQRGALNGAIRLPPSATQLR
jgi:hypothetical protein